MKNYSILIAVLIFHLVVLSACGAPHAGGPSGALATVPPDCVGRVNPLDQGASAEGAAVFKTYCASCHGDGGQGDGAAGMYLDPRPANLVKLNAMVADDFLYWRITTGREGTSMPAWKGVLDDRQTWQVIAFIRTLK